MKKVISSVILVILILAILMTNYVVSNNFNFWYSNYNGEYVHSPNSNQTFYLTDVLYEKNVKLISALVSNNSIYALYFNEEQNSLKLAVSKTFTPKSTNDWQVHTIIKNAVIDKNASGVWEYSDYYRVKFIMPSNLIDFKIIDGKPCIAFVTKSLDEISPIYTLNLLISNSETPLSESDWLLTQNEIQDFYHRSKITLGSFKDNFIVITTTHDGQKNEKGTLDTLTIAVLNSYNIKSKHWINIPVLTFKEDFSLEVYTGFIEDPNDLYIIYSKMNVMNRKNPKVSNILCIPNFDLKNKANWIDSRLTIASRYFATYENLVDYSNYLVVDKKIGKYYFFVEDKQPAFRLVTFYLNQRKPEKIKDIPIYGSIAGNYLYQSGGKLNMSNDYRQLFWANSKLTLSVNNFGNLFQFKIDQNKKIPSVQIENVDFFNKFFSLPYSFKPISNGKELSYIYYQANLGKIRFAREINPSEVPKTDFFSLFGLK